MHTDQTLAILDEETTALGDQIRNFKSSTCSQYETYELSRETQARQRRASKKPGSLKSPSGSTQGRRPKTLNLQTYKAHSLGDYVSTIKQYGTTDSYNTAIVSCPLLVAGVILNFTCSFNFRASWSTELLKQGTREQAGKTL